MNLRLNVFGFFRFQTARLAVLEEDMENLSDPHYSIFAAWGLYQTNIGNLLFLLDVKRDRYDGDGFLKAHLELRAKWKTRGIFMHTTSFETKVAKDMIDAGCQIERMGDGEDAYAYIDDDPYARVIAATKFLKSKRLFVPSGAPFMGEVLKEWTSFPKATHADCVEALCLACVVAGKEGKAPVWAETERRIMATPRDRDTPRDPTDGYYLAKPRELG